MPLFNIQGKNQRGVKRIGQNQLVSEVIVRIKYHKHRLGRKTTIKPM